MIKPMFCDSDFKTSSASQIWIPLPHCVEVAHRDGVTAVRSTKERQGSTLFFDADEWQAFVAGVKSGEFDFGL